MKKAKKVLYTIILSFTLSITFCSAYVYAAGGNISGIWYSGTYTAGYWANQPDIYIRELSVDTHAGESIRSVVSNGVTTWRNAGIPCVVTTSPSVAEIDYYGGTKAELNVIGFEYTDDILGLTKYLSYTMSTPITNNSFTITTREYNRVIASTASERTYAQATTTHELGHCLGWEGHHTSNIGIMYGDSSQAAPFSQADSVHLQQIYEAVK